MGQVSRLDWAMVGVLAVGSTLWLGALQLAPRGPGSDVAVVFAPWTRAGDAATRAAEAGAQLVDRGRWPFIIVVRPFAAHYVARAIGAGALAVIHPRGLAGCLVRREPA